MLTRAITQFETDHPVQYNSQKKSLDFVKINKTNTIPQKQDYLKTWEIRHKQAKQKKQEADQEKQNIKKVQVIRWEILKKIKQQQIQELQQHSNITKARGMFTWNVVMYHFFKKLQRQLRTLIVIHRKKTIAKLMNLVFHIRFNKIRPTHDQRIQQQIRQSLIFMGQTLEGQAGKTVVHFLFVIKMRIFVKSGAKHFIKTANFIQKNCKRYSNSRTVRKTILVFLLELERKDLEKKYLKIDKGPFKDALHRIVCIKKEILDEVVRIFVLRQNIFYTIRYLIWLNDNGQHQRIQSRLQVMHKIEQILFSNLPERCDFQSTVNQLFPLNKSTHSFVYNQVNYNFFVEQRPPRFTYFPQKPKEIFKKLILAAAYAPEDFLELTQNF